MSESAFERSLYEGVSSLRAFVQRHDRFVLMGFVFSLLPLPPACFLGFVIGLINTWLLCIARLPLQERKLVLLGLFLSVVNSLLALTMIVWGYQYFSGLGEGEWTLAGVSQWVFNVLRSWPFWWRGDGSAQGGMI